MTVTVEWPMRLPSVANLREHWATKAKRVKQQRLATRMWLLIKRVEDELDFWRDLDTVAIRMTRIAPRALDDDNLASAFKAVRDEVASYFGLDDRDKRLRFIPLQAKGKTPMVRLEFDVVETEEQALALVTNTTEGK